MSHPQREVDVLIVGAGPAGTTTAIALARKGFAGRIVVIDRARFPREKLCGGAVTHMGEVILSRLGLGFEPEHVPIREVRATYAGHTCHFRGDPILRITRRVEFDDWLVRKTMDLGIEIRQGESLLSLQRQTDHVLVTSTRESFRARVLVGADGSRSVVRRLAGLRDHRSVARLLEVLTPQSGNENLFRDRVATFEFGSGFSGLSGYAWDFPSVVQGQPIMNRGVYDGIARPTGEPVSLKGVLASYLERRGLRLDDVTLQSHPIRTFNPKGAISLPHMILVGDAAGVDPLLGEGISFALGYGEVAAQAILAAFEATDFGFADYSRFVHAHPLLAQLPARVRLASWLSHIRNPRLASMLFQLGHQVVKHSRWNDAAFVPAAAPHRVLRA